MAAVLVRRWKEYGKPLFLIPKDFKERILTSGMDQEIKLNYLKWLTQGVEIDMFELLSILIMYARDSLEDRLKVLFKLYCFEEEDSMQQDEFKFMMEKLSISFGSTLSIKKAILLEMVKSAENRILPEKEQILERDFVQTMVVVIKEFLQRLQDISDRLTLFNDILSKDRLPAYLRPGSNFLGKCVVDDVIPYSRIYSEQLWTLSSVFDVNVELEPGQKNQQSGKKQLKQ